MLEKTYIACPNGHSHSLTVKLGNFVFTISIHVQHLFLKISYFVKKKFISFLNQYILSRKNNLRKFRGISAILQEIKQLKREQ